MKKTVRTLRRRGVALAISSADPARDWPGEDLESPRLRELELKLRRVEQEISDLELLRGVILEKIERER